MKFLKKLFGKGKEEHKTADNTSNKVENENDFDLKWIEPTENPWNVKVLDLRPISQTMLSTSKDALKASNAMSYGQDDGISFIGKQPQSDRVTTAEIAFKTDGKLLFGALFIPSAMEQKWAIYYHNNQLIFIRSWLREVFVVADTIQEDNKLVVTKIYGEFVGEDSGAFTKAVLSFLICSHVLGDVVPAPLPDWMISDTNAAGLWAFSTYGNMAHIGYFDTDFNYTNTKTLRSHSLLHIAIARGDETEITNQLALGADINALAADGLATMHWAFNPKVLKFLIQKGADPNVVSLEGATPLMNAVQSNEAERVQILLDNKANVNAQDYRGFTALHRAAEMGHEKLVGILLDHGADKNIVAEGHTALSLAKMREEMAIVSMLENT